jgi:hypothetical protein
LSAVWKIIWMHGSIVGLPKSMQASEFKDSGREFMWAIKNTPIPSQYTSWLIGFPTMGYHNPQ